ncbi:MAG: LOG family protein [Dysgonomonas sp.]
MKTNKYATLFCGAMNIPDSTEYIETVQIGELLAQKGYIVKSGGYGGMMEAISKGATEEGGKAIGFVFKATTGNCYLSETVECEHLYQRLQFLIQESSLFIVQRGGIGTLSELFLCLDIIRKIPKAERPRVILVGEFWWNVMNVLKTELIPPKDYGLFTIVKDFKQFKGCL